MTDIHTLIRRFSETAQELALKRNQVTDQVLDGLGKGFLSGLNEEEISFLKRLIDSLK